MKRILLTLALVGLVLAPAGAQSRAVGHRIRQTSNTYTTTFAGTQNPLSQGGRWIHGGQTGIDWHSVQISGGLAYGTQTPDSGFYDDSIAVLSGTWANDQTVTATVHLSNLQTGTCYEEVELWTRTTITPHTLKGYETNFRATHDGTQYIGVVASLGARGTIGQDNSTKFTQLGVNCDNTNGYTRGLFDGDVIKVTIVGNVITAYVNGTQQCQRTDGSSLYASGSPGMGHWAHLNGATGVSMSDYGLTAFTATACASGPC